MHLFTIVKTDSFKKLEKGDAEREGERERESEAYA